MNFRIKFIKKGIDLLEKYTFERKIKNFYRKLSTDKMNIIDVGSNTGQSMDLFISVFPGCKIYSIEANPDCFDLLNEKYKGKEKIELFNIGISDSNSRKKFYINVLDTTSTLESINQDSDYLKMKKNVLGVKDLIEKVIDIDVVTLESFIKESKIEKVDLIKIDTEGHELNCLQGLLNETNSNFPQYLQLEMHFDDMYENKNKEIESLLSKYKFKLLKSIKHSFGNFEDRIYMLEN